MWISPLVAADWRLHGVAALQSVACAKVCADERGGEEDGDCGGVSDESWRSRGGADGDPRAAFNSERAESRRDEIEARDKERWLLRGGMSAAAIMLGLAAARRRSQQDGNGGFEGARIAIAAQDDYEAASHGLRLLLNELERRRSTRLVQAAKQGGGMFEEETGIENKRKKKKSKKKKKTKERKRKTTKDEEGKKMEFITS